ncbi:MAG TPA: lysozyme [Candidatus Obscuribacterales bacterium]
MIINQATVDLVKRFEGLRLEAYQDSVGVWTIGYGTTAMAGLGITPRAGMTITEAQAEEYLRLGLEKFADEIRPHIHAPINENQFGAFVSLSYNIGSPAFIQSSALRFFNAGETDKAGEAMLWWNKAKGKTLRGLVLRREAELELFRTPVVEPEKDSKSIWELIVNFLVTVLNGGRSGKT